MIVYKEETMETKKSCQKVQNIQEITYETTELFKNSEQQLQEENQNQSSSSQEKSVNKRNHSSSRSSSRSSSQSSSSSSSYQSRQSSSSSSSSKSKSYSYKKTHRCEQISKCLYISNLSDRVTESNLRKIFEGLGDIEYINVCYKPYSQQQTGIKVPAGYAFIKFYSERDSQRALNQLNNQIIKGKQIKIQYSRRENPRNSTTGPYHNLKNIKKSSQHNRVNQNMGQFSDRRNQQYDSEGSLDEKQQASSNINLLNDQKTNRSLLNEQTQQRDGLIRSNKFQQTNNNIKYYYYSNYNKNNPNVNNNNKSYQDIQDNQVRNLKYSSRKIESQRKFKTKNKRSRSRSRSETKYS